MVGSDLGWFLEFTHNNTAQILNCWFSGGGEVEGGFSAVFLPLMFSSEKLETDIISCLELVVPALLWKVGHKPLLRQVVACNSDASSP